MESKGKPTVKGLVEKPQTEGSMSGNAGGVGSSPSPDKAEATSIVANIKNLAAEMDYQETDEQIWPDCPYVDRVCSGPGCMAYTDIPFSMPKNVEIERPPCIRLRAEALFARMCHVDPTGSVRIKMQQV